MNIYHYVYRITNIVEQKYYYGKRSSKIEPNLDLGKKYFSSSTDKDFIQDQKDNPQNYKYKIIRMFDDAKSAVDYETALHMKFWVGANPNFYNIVTQTHNGFDQTGKFLCENKTGNKLRLSRDDIRFISGEYKSVKLGWCIPGRIFTAEHRTNLSKASKGKPKPKEQIQKGLETKRKLNIGFGKNHPRSKYIYVTPWGEFDSPEALEPIFTMSRMKNMCIHNEKKMYPSVYYRCDKLMNTFSESDINKTYKELGFSIRPSK